MKYDDKILILGGSGLVGSSLFKMLTLGNYNNILKPKRKELDLFSQAETLDYFLQNKPKHVLNAAAIVGGIKANNEYRADFIHKNIMIQSNVFEASYQSNVKRLLFLGSSCIYPKNCPQPIKENYLLTNTLEQTNEPYAIAKIAGIKTAESFRKQFGLHYISVMPTNLYGENDNFDLNSSHVIPGLIARMYQAKINNDPVFKIWGSGKPKREFLYVDDMARACILIMNTPIEDLPNIINIGSGTDISILDLANKIKDKIGLKARLDFDSSMPDGVMRKLLDIKNLKKLGWKQEYSLDEGLDKTINFYKEKYVSFTS